MWTTGTCRHTAITKMNQWIISDHVSNISSSDMDIYHTLRPRVVHVRDDRWHAGSRQTMLWPSATWPEKLDTHMVAGGLTEWWRLGNRPPPCTLYITGDSRTTTANCYQSVISEEGVMTQWWLQDSCRIIKLQILMYPSFAVCPIGW